MKYRAIGWVLALGLWGCAKDSPELGGGPYVQDVTPTSAVVGATTPGPMQLRVKYGPGETLNQEVTEAEAATYHGLRLEGLSAQTTYRYALETLEGVILGTGTFHTAPGDRAARCRFLVLGDSGGTDDDDGALIDAAEEAFDDARGASDDENQQGKVASAMLGREADLVLHLGDIVYPSGAREDYAEGYFRPFGPLIADLPVYPTIGNHDVKTEGGQPLLDIFSLPGGGPTEDGRVYSFDWGCVHFVCLDVISTPFEAGSPQLEWLRDDLANHDGAWTVVYFHVPPFSPTRGDAPELVEHVVPVLEAGGVDLVLSGHDHAYARFFPRERAVYVVSGGGGKNLYSVAEVPGLAYAESVFHFLQVEATPTELTVEAIDASGGTFDRLVLRR